jgi:hypothetical protein
LRRSVEDALNNFRLGTASLEALNVLANEWLSEPFQADVADYFLRGPGTQKEPFASFLAKGVTIPPP